MVRLLKAGLMRTSEIFAKNKKVAPYKMERASIKALWMHNLKATRDPKTGKIKFYTVTVRATKTEKGHQDVEIVWANGKFPVSPAQLLTRYLQVRMNMANRPKSKVKMGSNQPLFQLLNGTIVTVADIKKRMEYLIIQMGLQSAYYTTYSFRIGGASSLARRGIDHRAIQVAGRWRSQAYALYIRLTPEQMAKNQSDILHMDVTHPNLVFLHQNVPQNLLVQA